MEKYEVKNIGNASEIREVYRHAKDNNIKYYRAVSKTNQIYGWNEQANNFVKAQAGQDWFENPHYQERIEVKTDILEEVEEVANEMVEEVKVEETVVEQVEKVDYKALYEEKCIELDKANAEKDIYIDKYQKVSEEFTAYREIVEKFKAL